MASKEILPAAVMVELLCESPSVRETKLHQGEEQVILRRTRTAGQVPWRFTWELLRIRKDGNLSAC